MCVSVFVCRTQTHTHKTVSEVFAFVVCDAHAGDCLLSECVAHVAQVHLSAQRMPRFCRIENIFTRRLITCPWQMQTARSQIMILYVYMDVCGGANIRYSNAPERGGAKTGACGGSMLQKKLCCPFHAAARDKLNVNIGARCVRTSKSYTRHVRCDVSSCRFSVRRSSNSSRT